MRTIQAKAKQGIVLLLAMSVLALVAFACAGEGPQTVEVEVTRIVPQTVEVTRIVQVVVTATPTPAVPTPEATEPSAPTATSTAIPTEVSVQPADARASAYIGGNASPPLPAGEPGKLTVVATGSYNGTRLPIVLRNNTGEDVIHMTVSAVARDADGNMLAAGGDQGINPNFVRPGEIAFGYVYFGYSVDLPPDATFEFEVDAKPASEDRFESIRDLDVVEQSLVEDRIVGRLQNSHDKRIFGPIGVVVVCFDTQGGLLDYYSDYTDKDRAGPGDTVPFQVDLWGPCPVFLVAARGFEY